MTDPHMDEIGDALDAPVSAPAPDEALPQTVVETPGTALRRAREARGQSVADVAQVIRFSARQIEALERDDYASLPGATAVRGLVRNYAKFLRIDAAPLLAQLAPSVPVPEADVRPPTNMGEAEQPTLSERVPPVLIVSGAALLLALLAGYWYFGVAGGGFPSGASRSAALPASARPAPVAAPAVVPVAQPAPAVVADTPAAAEAAPATPPPVPGLRIEFDDRSWVEVRDATQKIVFVGEYPAGTRQNIEGKAPFQVWIGKASGVRLFMGERSVDLKPHTREEVARFTLE